MNPPRATPVLLTEFLPSATAWAQLSLPFTQTRSYHCLHSTREYQPEKDRDYTFAGYRQGQRVYYDLIRPYMTNKPRERT